MRKIIRVYGPYVKTLKDAKGPRRFVRLLLEGGVWKDTSYARYLMEQHLGRELLPTEAVDHIDNNPMNDRIENYQILTPAENVKKSAKGRTMVNFVCPTCANQFQKELRHANLSKKRGAPSYCSRRCSTVAAGKKSGAVRRSRSSS